MIKEDELAKEMQAATDKLKKAIQDAIEFQKSFIEKLKRNKK